jgi:hypothetical protein
LCALVEILDKFIHDKLDHALDWADAGKSPWVVSDLALTAASM